MPRPSPPAERAPPRPPPRPAVCELCGRAVAELTRHHLIPRMRHRSARVQRTHDRAELGNAILWICRPCHDHIHELLSEKELAERYASREALLAHPGVRQFVDWLAARPPDFVPRGSRAPRRD